MMIADRIQGMMKTGRSRRATPGRRWKISAISSPSANCPTIDPTTKYSDTLSEW